jgi:threonine 3-dehydrogenase
LGTVTGHETCGIIVGLGEGVTSRKIGDEVAIECHFACWECPRCEEGNAHVCEKGTIFGVHQNGAFAPYFTVPAVNARVNPPEVSIKMASIQDPLGNAIHTLTGGPVQNSVVAIHGLGPIGLFAVNAAKAMGAKFVIGIDWDNHYRMNLAKELGADLVLSKENDVVNEILEITNGKGVDNSCEFSGSPSALSNAIKSTRMGGYLNVLSVYGDDLTPVPMNEIVFRYLHLKGINGRRMWSTWDTMHHLLSEGNLDVDQIITHRWPISKFKEAMELVKSGNCGKMVLEF